MNELEQEKKEEELKFKHRFGREATPEELEEFMEEE